jgi:hypothetical protein
MLYLLIKKKKEKKKEDPLLLQGMPSNNQFFGLLKKSHFYGGLFLGYWANRLLYCITYLTNFHIFLYLLFSGLYP